MSDEKYTGNEACKAASARNRAAMTARAVRIQADYAADDAAVTLTNLIKFRVDAAANPDNGMSALLEAAAASNHRHAIDKAVQLAIAADASAAAIQETTQ